MDINIIINWLINNNHDPNKKPKDPNLGQDP